MDIKQLIRQHWPIAFVLALSLMMSSTFWRLGLLGNLLWVILITAGVLFDFLVVQREQQPVAQTAGRAITKVKQEASTPTRAPQAIWNDINSMVGLVPVKQRLKEIIDNIQANYIRQQAGIDTTGQTLHMVFTGNPGTGKTEIARKVGELLCAIGALPGPAFVQANKSDLIGQYVGHTAPKVQKIMDSILEQGGGILFVDEAYSLTNAEGSGADFGREAVEELMQHMENHRDKLCVILAGYKGEMEHFVNKTNPGLKSRIPYYIDFPDYSPDELIQILKLHAGRKGYSVADGAIDKVSKHLSKVNMRVEGNGRYIRNLLEKAITKQSSRILQGDDPRLLTVNDFTL